MLLIATTGCSDGIDPRPTTADCDWASLYHLTQGWVRHTQALLRSPNVDPYPFMPGLSGGEFSPYAKKDSNTRSTAVKTWALDKQA
jgi:hypothetical protein